MVFGPSNPIIWVLGPLGGVAIIGAPVIRIFGFWDLYWGLPKLKLGVAIIEARDSKHTKHSKRERGRGREREREMYIYIHNLA